MTPLYQPSKRSCGQTCVAMAAGITVAASIKLFGHSRGTTTYQIQKVLKGLGLIETFRFERVTKNNPLPGRAVCKMRFQNPHSGKWRHRWHWVLWWDGRLYDPAEGHNPLWWEISSFIRLG